jgi:hypothetical protein
MSIFICWSGDRSHDLARALKVLLTATLKTQPDSDVFISDDIEKGASWFDSIDTQLQTSRAGVVCLTAENLESPWLHFEAGALAQGLARQPPRNRLFTLLHGVTGAELHGPLATYQATTTTRSEMTAMIRSIASVHGEANPPAAESRQLVIADSDWETFDAALKTLAVPARKLIADLEALFQRKTFNEPLHRCADQSWLQRYDGAKLTREKLREHRDKVTAACSPHERGVFEMLLTELEGYAMAIQALLLTPKTFPLGVSGDLTMPAGVQPSCEQRRLAIRSLAGILLHPIDEPLCDDAVRFMGAETNEERKMMVHRMESEIRREREAAFEAAVKDPRALASWHTPIGKLTGKRQPIAFRESSWDLDRIYYYLLIQYFGLAALRWEKEEGPAAEPVAMRHDWLCAGRDVEIEVERYRARSKGGSLMPLTYALVALQEIDRQASPEPRETAAAVQRALQLVESELGDSGLSSEPGKPIALMLRQMRSAPVDPARPPAITGPAAVGV